MTLTLDHPFLADHPVPEAEVFQVDDSANISHPQGSGSLGKPSYKQVTSETLTDERDTFENRIEDDQNLGTLYADDKADNVDSGHGADGANNANTDDKDRKVGLQSDLSRLKFTRREDVAVSESPIPTPKPSKVPPGHTHHVDVDDDEGEE